MIGDISASASNSSGAGTGAIKFGNVTIGTAAGGSSGGFPTWAIWVIVGGAALLVWKLFLKKK